jgi:secernin
MWGVEGGVNEAGVAVGNERITTTLDPRLLPDALTGMDLVRLALERGGSATEALEVIVDLLGRYGQGGSCEADRHAPYWSSFLIADGQRAYKLETSGRAYEYEAINSVGAISNRTTIASFDAEHRHPRQPVETLVDPRLACSLAVIGHRPVTLDAVQPWQRSHDAHPDAPGWSVCMHVTDKGHEQCTTAAFVAELPASATKVRQRSRMWVTLGSPCVSVAIPLIVGEEPFGEPPRWERFAQLTAAHRDAMDELQTWLRAELPTPEQAWSEVTAVLYRLGL